MATWKEGKNGVTEFEISREDLMFSNISITKDILCEVLNHRSVNMNIPESHSCDSSGVQLLLLFVREIKRRGGVISFGPFLNGKSEAGTTEWERILMKFGIQDFTLAETGER